MSPIAAIRVPALINAIFFVATLLAGCNGSGGDSGTTVPPSTAGTGSQLYVSGNTSPRLLIYNDANTISGSTPPNRVVSGGLTTLSGPRGIAVDMARDQIYVANFLNDSILVFYNARTVTGGVAPNRTITGTSLDGPTALFIDVVNDRLFVTSTNDNSILIYDNASTLNGTVVPSRTLTGNLAVLTAPMGIYVDTTRNLVYVANGNNQILVFNSAVIVAGSNNIAPLRSIPISSGSAGIFVDIMADRLYAASANSILIFDGASTANSGSVPSRTIFGGGSMLSQPRDIFVDTGTDRLYVANFGSNSILVFNNASTVDGAVTPERTLNLTLSTDPWGVYVDVTPIVIGSTATLDGFARSDGTASASGSPATGDKDASYSVDVGWRQLYSFDIASIPVSSTIISAILRLYQCDVSGLPYTSLGDVVVDHVNYGAVFDPFGTAYNSATVAFNIGTLSTNASLGYRSMDVMARIQNDLAVSRARSQYRLKFFPIDTNFDFMDDFAQFTDAEDSLCDGSITNQPPQLAITLRP
jgi:DNA-binding beta-propeller fold protein YncE